MALFLGIDPGLSGALALYSPDRDTLSVVDVPVLEVPSNGRKRRIMDLYALAAMFDAWSLLKIDRAVIEDVHAMPGQGVSSMFKFGFTAGALQMACACQFVPMLAVAPARWKKALGLTGDKDASRRLASQLLPRHAQHWARGKDDGRAESALLAYYGSKL